jgi:hypothetical protein
VATLEYSIMDVTRGRPSAAASRAPRPDSGSHVATLQVFDLGQAARRLDCLPLGLALSAASTR